MKTIYKYNLDLGGNTFEMPADADVLTAQMQHGRITLWAKVDTDKSPMKRRFTVFGTGHQMYEGLEYIATVQQAEGALIWHIFEEMD
jgi:hypothetical protein